MMEQPGLFPAKKNMEDRTKTLAQLAAMVHGEVDGDPDIRINSLADLETATEGSISFIVKAKNSEQILSTKASAVIIPQTVSASFDKPLLRVRDPYWAAAVIHNFFLAKPFVSEGIDPMAVIGAECSIPDEVAIGPFAVLGDRVRLGRQVKICSGVVIGDDVTIGDNTTVRANASIRWGCSIGARVIIHDGAVVGSDGFGYASDEHGHIKRPHVGTVRIDDDVEIGANTCIDRATFGTTWIKRGAKIDNLVQIGHNVVVGEHSLLVAQVGIAGSTSLGKGVVLGGQVGLAGHLQLGDRVMVGAKSGVHNNQQDGAVISGIPAIPHKVWLRASLAFGKLPDLVKEVRQLRKKLLALGEKSDEPDA